jgi:hypothetical protein
MLIISNNEKTIDCGGLISRLSLTQKETKEKAEAAVGLQQVTKNETGVFRTKRRNRCRKEKTPR